MFDPCTLFHFLHCLSYTLSSAVCDPSILSDYNQDRSCSELQNFAAKFDWGKVGVSLQSRKSVRGERKGPDGRDHGRKAITDDLVSVINDGLYFYEQVWSSIFFMCQNL